MMKSIIGLDIGGTKCAVVLAAAGPGIRILDRIEFPTGTGRGPEGTLGELSGTVRELLSRHGVGKLEAIGVSCGGPLDSTRGLILSPPNLPGWDHVPITGRLEAEFGVPVFLQNDANACALVEWKLGAGKGSSDMVFLTMGTGMGAGIISGGRLLIGASDLAGEVGHIRLAETGPEGYGKPGSFEGFCSGGGIGRAARARAAELLGKGRAPSFCGSASGLEEVDTRKVTDAAKAGDREAVRILEDTGRMLGRGISILIDVLNPEVVVIGSVFVRAEQFLRPAMEAEIAREALPSARKVCRVLPAETGESLGDYASVMTAVYGLGISPDVENQAEGTAVQASRQVAAGPRFRDGSPDGFTLSALPDARAQAETQLRLLSGRYPALSGSLEAHRSAFLMLVRCFERGGKVLVCGNGGSAADAEHIVGELMKGFRKRRPLPDAVARKLASLAPLCGEDPSGLLQRALPAIALTGHTALSTAFVNDVSAKTVFAQQVLGYGRPGDVLIALSTSGNSGNVVLAAAAARSAGLGTISFTGPAGGKLKALSDVLIAVPGATTAEIQELHLPSYHALCAMVEDAFFSE